MAVSFDWDYITTRLLPTIDGSKNHRKISIDIAEGQVTILTGETWNVLVGSLYAFSVEVTVNGEPATVLSSQWSLQGTTIDWDAVSISAEASTIPTTDGEEIVGGLTGDPAMIMAGWASPLGTYNVTISGTAASDGAEMPFQVGASVVVGPIQVSQGLLGVETDPPEYDNGIIAVYTQGYAVPVLGFDGNHGEGFAWDASVTPEDEQGFFTFVQLISLSLATRTAGDGTEQSMGVQLRTPPDVLDGGMVEVGTAIFPTYSDGDEPSFAQSPGTEPFSIEDGPYEGLYATDEDGDNFVQYVRTDSFATYLAFVSTGEAGFVTGVPVGLTLATWGWSGTAVLNTGANAWDLTACNTDDIVVEDLSAAPVLLEWGANGSDPQFNDWYPEGD